MEGKEAPGYVRSASHRVCTLTWYVRTYYSDTSQHANGVNFEASVAHTAPYGRGYNES
jgi:hypothetical protein